MSSVWSNPNSPKLTTGSDSNVVMSGIMKQKTRQGKARLHYTRPHKTKTKDKDKRQKAKDKRTKEKDKK
jgi:hypothetical protein